MVKTEPFDLIFEGKTFAMEVLGNWYIGLLEDDLQPNGVGSVKF